MPKREIEQLVAEIAWLKRRLQRVEHAIEPLVEDLIASKVISSEKLVTWMVATAYNERERQTK